MDPGVLQTAFWAALVTICYKQISVPHKGLQNFLFPHLIS